MCQNLDRQMALLPSTLWANHIYCDPPYIARFVFSKDFVYCLIFPWNWAIFSFISFYFSFFIFVLYLIVNLTVLFSTYSVVSCDEMSTKSHWKNKKLIDEDISLFLNGISMCCSFVKDDSNPECRFVHNAQDHLIKDWAHIKNHSIITICIEQTPMILYYHQLLHAMENLKTALTQFMCMSMVTKIVSRI